MRERLREFSLSLHPDKTRLIEFGRFAAQNCSERELANPETFTFLGFVLICGTTRNGKFLLRRKSRRDRMRAKLREIKEELRGRMHSPIPETGKWLAQVVSGFQAYHAVPPNSAAIGNFRYRIIGGTGYSAGAARRDDWCGWVKSSWFDVARQAASAGANHDRGSQVRNRLRAGRRRIRTL